MKTIKKKFAKIPKYPYGGQTPTPEQIQYKEYLMRNGQDPNGANYATNGRYVSDNIYDNKLNNYKSQLGTRSTINSVGETALGASTPYGGLILGARSIADSALPQKIVTDPITGQKKTEYTSDFSADAHEALTPVWERAGKSFSSGNTGRGIAEILGLGSIGGRDAQRTMDSVFGKNTDPEEEANKLEAARIEELKKQQKFNDDKSALSSYALKGNQDVNYYNKKGGKIKYANYDGVNKGYSMMKNGGSIHIKPSHEDRFTEYKERTGETTEEALHSTNPHVRQMANFARNASHWKHELGGKLIPIASDVELAKGATHEQGGITLTSPQGTPYAEIENNEVKKDDKIYSDTLEIRPGITYSKEATKLGTEKGKFEFNLKSTDLAKKGTAERMVQRKDLELNNLFENQEMKKSNEAKVQYAKMGGILKKYYSGGSPLYDYYKEKQKIIDENEPSFYNQASSDVANSVPREIGNSNYNTNNDYTPINSNSKSQKSKFDYNKALDTGFNVARFADNIYNSKLINETPDVPAPHLQQAAKLETNYNVDNATNENRNAYTTFAKNIDSNVTNSNNGNANKMQAYVEQIKRNNQIYGDKINIETQLKNQNSLNAQQVGASNLAKLDNYDTNRYNRNLMIKGEKSSNMANIVEDIGKIGTERSEKQLDNSRISHIMKLYNENPAAARKNYKDYYKAAKSTGNLKELKQNLSRDKSGKELWNSDPDNQNDLITD